MVDGLSWETIKGLIAVCGFLGAVCTFGIGYGRLRSRVEATERRAEAAERRAERACEKVDEEAAKLAAFREQAVREFVSIETLGALEDRIINAVNRLADRLDRLFQAKADG